MGKRNVIIAGLAALVGGTVFAADAAFENHLTSTPMVSPAQLYQVQDLKTDFALGILNESDTNKQKDQDETKDSSTGTALFAAGIYNVKDLGLRAGLSVNYGSMSGESEDLYIDETSGTVSTSKADWDGTEMVVTPQAAYTAGPVVLGVAYEVVQRTEKVEDLDERKSSHTRFRPGVLFANSDLEAGLAYTSATKRDAKDPEKDLSVYEPAKVTAHGRYAIDRNLAAGAILENRHYKGIDDDLLKDQTVLKGTVEYGMGDVKIDGQLGYNTAFYKDKDVALSEGTIGTYELGAAADYSINKTSAVGGGLVYETGSDKNDSVEVATNTVAFSVRGNMKF